MLHIHRVKADDGGVQPHVGFRDMIAEIEGTGVLGQMGFGAVERVEKGAEGFFVGFLRSIVLLMSEGAKGEREADSHYVANPAL